MTSKVRSFLASDKQEMLNSIRMYEADGWWVHSITFISLSNIMVVFHSGS